MSIDIGAFGAGITIVAVQSFPVGFQLSSFADDEDPLVIDPIEPTGFEPLYDGSIFTFDKTAPVMIKTSVIPGSDDDTNLRILLQSRKSGVKLIPLPDTTTMIINYPGNGVVAFTNGSIIRGPLADSIMANGRKKGNTYGFVFGSFAGAQSLKQVVATAAQSILQLI